MSLEPPSTQVPDVVARYAPVVVLHRDEKLLPASVDWFIERSSLRWANGRDADGEAVPGVEGAVDTGRLGAASPSPYRYRDYVASALTRPLDDSAARHGHPPLEQGFFLPLREEASARGAKSTSPDASVYTGVTTCFEYDDQAKAITYWLFYAGSAPPLGILRVSEQVGLKARDASGLASGGAPDEVAAAVAAASLEEFQRAYPSLANEAGAQTVGARGLGDVLQRVRVVAEGVRALLRDDDVLHEGDWERITVYLDLSDPEAATPASVAFYRHSTNTFRTWAEVEKEAETHPVVYSAIGSHASLPSADFGFIDVGDAHGVRWRTWEPDNGLASVREQPWYGFGGAWGTVGRVLDSTGPLGPGAHWKYAAPRPG